MLAGEIRLTGLKGGSEVEVSGSRPRQQIGTGRFPPDRFKPSYNRTLIKVERSSANKLSCFVRTRNCMREHQ